ncbi:hypothetical protein FHT08_000215 [Xanthomonas campestris]|nr:hypothetical protein [Xanthomonas sp. CFBP 8151]
MRCGMLCVLMVCAVVPRRVAEAQEGEDPVMTGDLSQCQDAAQFVRMPQAAKAGAEAVQAAAIGMRRLGALPNAVAAHHRKTKGPQEAGLLVQRCVQIRTRASRLQPGP